MAPGISGLSAAITVRSDGTDAAVDVPPRRRPGAVDDRRDGPDGVDLVGQLGAPGSSG